MSTKQVLKNLETTIMRVCDDIREKKAGSGVDKLDSLSKLVNSYSRLLERERQKDIDPLNDVGTGCDSRIDTRKRDMRGVIR